MVNSFRAYRRFERFLFLTPHDITNDEVENKLIATVIFHHDTNEVEIIREDERKEVK
ncbi:MAG: hypothetical protein WC389_17335 [Lutibacter sp.]|jgi:hypothetical protein